MVSDGDVCNSYLRLKDNHIRYIVIDPNIGTVVQWSANQSLFHRLFARVDDTTNTIIEDGSMTMLTRLFDAGQLRFVSSNNLPAKYAFTVPAQAFSGVAWDDLALFRAKMALWRYFNDPGILNVAMQIAQQRVVDGWFITDIADLLWLVIDEQKLVNLVQQEQLTSADIAELSQDERKAVVQFINLRQQAVTNQAQFDQQLQQILWNSMGWGNQIIVLELL